ncbi:MAG TPA: hypothetical protein VN646_19815 [Candidatus Acidoferrum sp.]|jgi:anti-anti-sigma regulatory factor|nr:hypothetical protein [Candidatus Acidoferrum sp.]
MNEDTGDDLDELEESGQVQLVGDLDAHAAEALRLQIRRLARQHGVDLTAVTIETEPDEPTSA